MKQFKRIAWIFIKKDWVEFRKPLIVLTCGSFVPILMIASDFAKGMMAGLLMAAPFIYAQSCFLTERRQGTLEFVLALPVTRTQLVLAKYASLFSMTLFTVNVPGLFLNDFRLLLYANLVTFSLGTFFMAATVISDKPWAAQLPLWLVVLATLPLRRSMDFSWVVTHTTLLSALAALLIPFMIVLSAWTFARKS